MNPSVATTNICSRYTTKGFDGSWKLRPKMDVIERRGVDGGEPLAGLAEVFVLAFGGKSVVALDGLLECGDHCGNARGVGAIEQNARGGVALGNCSCLFLDKSDGCAGFLGRNCRRHAGGTSAHDYNVV